MAGLERMNQTDRLANKYMPAAGAKEYKPHTVSPAEVAEMMDASVPSMEYTVEPEEQVWPHPPIPSCSPPVSLDDQTTGTGASSV